MRESTRCACGCNRLAAFHHGPYTQRHSDWCLHLLKLHILTDKHYGCVKLEKKSVELTSQMPVAIS